jgi:hypothetical protein
VVKELVLKANGLRVSSNLVCFVRGPYCNPGSSSGRTCTQQHVFSGRGRVLTPRNMQKEVGLSPRSRTVMLPCTRQTTSKKIQGVMRESNSRPPAPEAGIIPLNQSPAHALSQEETSSSSTSDPSSCNQLSCCTTELTP